MNQEVLDKIKKTGLSLVNEEKLDRVINGVVLREGRAEGGLGENAPVEDIIAKYDSLGGLIMKGKYKVKTGCFWDVQKKQQVKDPKVVFIFTDIAGNFVEVPEGEDKPMEVKAAEVAKEARKAKKVKKPKKDEDNEDEE